MIIPAFRRQVVLYGCIAVGLLLATVIVNLVVDPYGIWRSVEATGFNAAKSERRNQIHLFKSADLRRPLPPVMITGSSRTAYGIDPTHPALKALGGAYNAATPGGHMRIIRRYLELALQANPGSIKTVILGLDFFEYNITAFNRPANTFSESRIRSDRPPFRDYLTALLSLDALTASVRTVLSNLRDPAYQPYFQNGQLTAIDMRRTVEARGMERRFRMSLDLYLNGSTRLRSFGWADGAFEELRRIVEISRKAEIDLIAFIPPTHAAHLEAIRYRGLWPQFQEWKRRIAAITPYWDFSGYNEITTETLRRTMSHYWDISHYRSSVGDRLLAQMLQKTPGIGTWVTNGNVGDHLASGDAGRAAFTAANPGISRLIETIARSPKQVLPAR